MPQINIPVKSHTRTLPSGKTTTVKRYTRTGFSAATPFKSKKGLFHLPLRTAIIVPSTKAKSRKISNREYQSRIMATRRFLSKTNGGYTSVKAVGGFTDNEGNLIKEDVAVVESYTTKPDYRNNREKIRDWLEDKGKEWGQESMGYEYEDDLYYVDSEKIR